MVAQKGGARSGAGRKAGGTNSNPPDIKHLARRYAGEAMDTLYRVMKNSKNESNRTVAAREILDRGFGKPTQAISGDPELPVSIEISWKK